MLTPSQARAVLEELAGAAAGTDDLRAVATSRLAGMDAADLVRLDDDARTGWTWSRMPWGSLPPGGEGAGEDAGLVAALASLHPDGRVRQRAVRVLAGRPGTLPAALLALRCVDHVAQVRNDAALGLAVHTSVEEARAALPVLLRVAGRAHGPGALTGYTDALLTRHGGPDVVLELVDVPDRRTRRWAFDRCLDADLLTAPALLRAAQDRHDQVVRRAAAEHLVDHRDVVEPAQLHALLTGRYADARVAAIVAVPDDHLTGDDLRAALLDRSTRVRDTARWRARLHGIDVAGFYRAVLDGSAQPPRTVVACLSGLGWVGDVDDVPAIARRLDDPSPAVRTAAVRALEFRAGPDEVVQRLGPLLLDPGARVASVAARALGRAPHHATRDAERAAWASTQPWSRRAAWRLARARGGWDRVEADLRAAADPDLAELGRTSLGEWLRTSAATTWNRPEGARADRIAALLLEAGLGEDAARMVAFHAGLRPRSASPTEADAPGPAGDAVDGSWWRRSLPR